MSNPMVQGRIVSSEVGNGPLLLLIPGLGLNTRIFTRLTQLLQSQYRCLCIEFSGDVPPRLARNCTIDSLTDEVTAFLAANKLTPHCVIGHSFGSFIGMRLAIHSPQLVPRMVLLSAVAHGHISLFSFFMPENLTHQDDLLRYNITRCVTPTFAQTPEFFQAVEDQLHHSGCGKCFIPLLRAATQFNIQADLSTIHCPTLVLTGEADLITPAAQANRLANGLFDATTVFLPDVAHLPQLEAPARTANAIQKFLGDC